MSRTIFLSRSLAQVPELMEKAKLWGGVSLTGKRVLVKPNLLRAVPLACTAPEVVATVCRYLLDCGAKLIIADSPGFGTARGVAKSIGLTEALRPLGLCVQPFSRSETRQLPSGLSVSLAREALETDYLLSLAKVKAHSQMLLSLSCKNLYGCIIGLKKAFHHAREGVDPLRFADFQASLLGLLPPTAGVADGLTAMHVTGPSGGEPFPLGLIALSESVVALDETICRILGKKPEEVPLQAALIRSGHKDCASSGCQHIFPLLSPEDFQVEGFQLPQKLQHTSFRPARLVKSCIRRIFSSLYPY